MFKRNTAKVVLSGEEYPIKCDMLVLEKIQDKYQDMSEFENKLTGFRPSRNQDGSIKKNEEGLQIGVTGIPDIKVLNDTLTWMLNEGMQVESGEEKEISREEAIRLVDISPEELGTKLHEEFMRCFERKNTSTTQNSKKMQNPKK